MASHLGVVVAEQAQPAALEPGQVQRQGSGAVAGGVRGVLGSQDRSPLVRQPQQAAAALQQHLPRQ